MWAGRQRGCPSSSHGELPGLSPSPSGPGSWPCPGYSLKDRWKDRQKQAQSKISFIYMVYSSRPPCCNPSLSRPPSMELPTTSSLRGLLSWDWISGGEMGKRGGALAQGGSPVPSAPTLQKGRKEERGRQHRTGAQILKKLQDRRQK